MEQVLCLTIFSLNYIPKVVNFRYDAFYNKQQKAGGMVNRSDQLFCHLTWGHELFVAGCFAAVLLHPSTLHALWQS